jgi:hypothetical protein
MLVALVDGQRSKPQPGLRGACPGCGGEMLSKCGEKLLWHWAHRIAECSYLSEPETEWHMDWKSRFPTECQEVAVDDHRADVKGARAVLEVQHSSIGSAAIRDREECYGEMLWVLDAVRFGGTGFADDVRIEHEGHGVYGYTWRLKGPKRSFSDSEKPIVLDLPSGLFLLGDSTARRSGTGRYLTSFELYAMVCGEDAAVVPHEWHERDKALSDVRQQHERVYDQMVAYRYEWKDAPLEYRRRFWGARGFQDPPTWLPSSSEPSHFIDNDFLARADEEFAAAARAIKDLEQFIKEEQVREQKRLEAWKKQEIERRAQEKSRREAAEQERLRLELLEKAEEEEKQRKLAEARKVSEERFRIVMEEQRRRAEQLQREREEAAKREWEAWRQEVEIRQRIEAEERRERERRTEQARREFIERAKAQLVAWKKAQPQLHYFTLALMWQAETGQELTGARVKELLTTPGSAAPQPPT